MKIIYDNIIFSLQKAGGISVVWCELLSRLLMRDNIDVKFIEYDNSNKNIFRKKLELDLNNIETLKHRNLKLKRYFDVKVNEKLPFIFHSSYYRVSSNPNAINITTVHDFTYEYFVKGFKKNIHSIQKFRSIRKSNHIICISRNTKRDLLSFLPDIDSSKIHVIYNGVSEDFKPLNNRESKYEQFDPYVLFIGSREKYKNFNLAVEAVSKTDFNLIIIGGDLSDKESKFINETIGMNRVIHKKGISNEKLNELYNNAYCLLYPSSYEGFGIPVIEAQKAGCPVIAFNASSIPEVIGETPLLMNDLSINEIIVKINLLKNPRIRQDIILNGFDNANRFSWDIMAEQISKLYYNIIHKK